MQTIEKYLADVTGSAVVLREPDPKWQDQMPLFLRTWYGLKRASLFGHDLVLAIKKTPTGDATPAQYAAHVRQFRTILGVDTVLVLPEIASFFRSRLVRLAVPFIVPGRQIFLPAQRTVDLRENFSRSRSRTVEKLSWATQAILLFHLLKKEVEGVSLQQLAGRTGYSRATLTNVVDELRRCEWCEVVITGKSRHLRFKVPPHELWTLAQDRLRSPVLKEAHTHWRRLPDAALPSGISALARQTVLADDDLPVVALRTSLYRQLLAQGELARGHDHTDSSGVVESWAYDPKLTAVESVVDPLSLYLSLKGSHDERVLKALDQVMGKITW